MTATSNASGYARLPSVRGLQREQTPTVFIVEHGEDRLFMPYQRNDRRLSYSRFDVGGEYGGEYGGNDSPQSNLRALLFTDRGLYRPGETVRFGGLVKRADWAPLGALPLGLRVFDPRGQRVHEHRMRLGDQGLIEHALATEAGSATGSYTATLFAVEDRQRERVLGSATFDVEEFQPDTLRISARLPGHSSQGWLTADNADVAVQLDNLFGQPAQQRRIAAELTLTPSALRLPGFPGYRFDDPYRRSDALRDIREPLADTTTNADGAARLPLDLARYQRGIYQLRVDVEGFDASGGRSVRTRTSAMMSPLETLVGYRSSSDLTYLQRNSRHEVAFIAVNAAGEATALAGLTRQTGRLPPRVEPGAARRWRVRVPVDPPGNSARPGTHGAAG